MQVPVPCTHLPTASLRLIGWCRFQAAIRLLLWSTTAGLLAVVKSLVLPDGARLPPAQLQPLTAQVALRPLVSIEEKKCISIRHAAHRDRWSSWHWRLVKQQQG